MTTRKKLLWALLCIFTIALGVRLFWYDAGYSNPLHFTSYPQSGYYEINPETLLVNLNQGKEDVFTPASDDIWNREVPNYDLIKWSQSDYLKIADALSKEVWHESLSLEDWEILSVGAEQDCMDNPHGFYYFEIVYFQKSGIRSWGRQYQARLIEIVTWQGLVRWGDGSFTEAILPGWGKTDFENFKITADDALTIAERNGGSEFRQGEKNRCTISTRLINYPPVSGYTNNNWRVDYHMGDFSVNINPFTGKFRVNN
jgi:hypothetical protein